MKRTLALLTAAAVAAGLAALPAAGAVKGVKLVDNKFRPSKVTVKRGTTVKFTWAGKNPHNVTAFSGPCCSTRAPRRRGRTASG